MAMKLFLSARLNGFRIMFACKKFFSIMAFPPSEVTAVSAGGALTQVDSVRAELALDSEEFFEVALLDHSLSVSARGSDFLDQVELLRQQPALDVLNADFPAYQFQVQVAFDDLPRRVFAQASPVLVLGHQVLADAHFLDQSDSYAMSAGL